MSILSRYELYQDNDPKHNAHICGFSAVYKCLQVIRTLAHSPNLNPIENIWNFDEKNSKFENSEIMPKRQTLHFMTNKQFCQAPQ